MWHYRFMGDELLTVEQAAQRLQMHADTVRRLLREGQLPGRKIGARHWRVPADLLKAYVEAGGIPSVAPKGSE
jgi:excisionase family DNA binding protein